METKKQVRILLENLHFDESKWGLYSYIIFIKAIAKSNKSSYNNTKMMI